MLTVICTDRNCIKVLLVVDKLLIAEVVSTLCTVCLSKSFCLAGNEIGECNNLYVFALKIALKMSFCNPTATDNADLNLLTGICFCFYLLFFESIAMPRYGPKYFTSCVFSIFLTAFS